MQDERRWRMGRSLATFCRCSFAGGTRDRSQCFIMHMHVKDYLYGSDDARRGSLDHAMCVVRMDISCMRTLKKEGQYAAERGGVQL